MPTPAAIRLRWRGAPPAGWPRTTAWMAAIVSNPLVREWRDAADRLPHIWFDDDLSPDTPPVLERSATGAPVDAPPAGSGVWRSITSALPR